MDRAHRHELKHDKFVERVGHTVEYAAEHKQQFVRYVIAAVVVLLVVLGGLWYSRSQAEARQVAFRDAIRTQEAPVGQPPNDFLKAFTTEAEKRTAVDKTWNDLIARYSGSKEAAIAHFYMGVNAADRGNGSEAEKHFKQAVDTGEEPYVSQARLTLAELYASMGKTADAEKLLRTLIDNPTVLVSKEQATIALAKLLAKSRPDEARKLLEPLRTDRGAASRTALTMLSELSAK